MSAFVAVRLPYSSTRNGALSGVAEPAHMRTLAPDVLPERPAVTVPSSFSMSSWLPCRKRILAFLAMMSDVNIVLTFWANFFQYWVLA